MSDLVKDLKAARDHVDFCGAHGLPISHADLLLIAIGEEVVRLRVELDQLKIDTRPAVIDSMRV